MRSVFLFFMLSCVFVSCESNDSDEAILESLIDARFEVCYYKDDLAQNKCDSVLISIFGQTLFKKNIDLDVLKSTMNCEVDGEIKLVPFGSVEHCVPNSYDLLYSIQVKGESIFLFRMEAGKDMQFEPVSTIIADHLRGYRYLLEGKFKINYSEAKNIARANNVDLEESFLELVNNENDSIPNPSSYHWEAELESDHNSVVLLLIDVMSGKTSKEVLTIENIE